MSELSKLISHVSPPIVMLYQWNKNFWSWVDNAILKFHKSTLISHFIRATNSSSPMCNAQFTNTSTYTISFHSEHNCDMSREDITIFTCQVRKAKYRESKSLVQGPS